MGSLRLLPCVLPTAILAVWGCTSHPAAVRGPKAVPAARAAVAAPATGVESLVQAVSLTGKVKLVSDNGGGLISDNGGGLISDNGGGVISNNTGNLISDNGGGVVANNGGNLIANNGGGLTSKVKWGLLSTQTPREFALADAVITFQDAAGKPVLDAGGKPLTATTDHQGVYKLTVPLPAKNLVMKVTLGTSGILKGGILTAMLPKTDTAKRTQAIDTSTSLGAAYVLGKFVQGSQAVYDKLPASDAATLERDLDAASSLLTSAPSYQPDALVGLTDNLRAKAPAIGKELDTIRVLLLGQTQLGNGRKATSVGLFSLTGIALAPDGGVFFGEQFFGRVREVTNDGTITTLADVLHGRVNQNFPKLADIACGPDGTVYVADAYRVYRIDPNGGVQTLIGTGAEPDGKIGAPLSTAVNPYSLAVASDGTLYVGEDIPAGAPSRLLAYKDGTLRELPLPAEVGGCAYAAIGVAADGAVYAFVTNFTSVTGSIYRYTPNKGAQQIASGFDLDAQKGGIAVAPDGTIYVSQAHNATLTAISTDGTRHVIAGPGAPANAPRLGHPNRMAMRSDGTLVLEDEGSELVRTRTKDGTWGVLAGTQDPNADATSTSDLSLDAPIGVAFDAQDRLLVAENGSGQVRRFDGTGFTTIAGSVLGNNGADGDGGPATSARFGPLTGITCDGDRLLISDPAHGALRVVDASGNVNPIVGAPNDTFSDPTNGQADVDADKRAPTDQFWYNGNAVTMGPDHLPYWVNGRRQICRLAADGQVELVAGKPVIGQGGNSTFTAIFGALTPDGALAKDSAILYIRDLAFGPDGDLYFTDFGGMQVRKVAGLASGNPTLEAVAGTPLTQIFANLSADPNAKEGNTAKTCGLIFPCGLCFDKAGNMYVTEFGTVALPLMTTLAGNDIPPSAGLPASYARVRKIAPDGTVTTIAGPGSRYLPDPKADDSLVLPTLLRASADGRLAVIDTGANLIHVLPAGSY